MSNEILEEIRSGVAILFQDDTPKHLLFHNLHHTEQVVRHAKEIAGHNALSKNDQFLLEAAAWFHDIGYLYTTPDKHEEKGVETMQAFLRPFCSKEEIGIIASTILSTKYPTNPKILLEKSFVMLTPIILEPENFFKPIF